MQLKYPVFFLESPFQLISAMEAIYSYQIVKYCIIVRLSGQDKNDWQMKNLVNNVYCNASDVEFVKIGIGIKSLSNIVNVLRLLYYLTFIYKRNVFLGNYNSPIVRVISRFVSMKKIILLDDGTLTLVIQNELREKRIPLTWFTMFNLRPFANQIVIPNHFSYLKGLLNPNISIRTGLLVFIGSNMELITSRENILKMLNKVCDYLQIKEGYYIPHRCESTELLSLIECHTPLQIKKMNAPIELIGKELGYFPSIFASFFSTALFSLKIICKGCCFVSFRFGYEKSIYKEDIDEVYATMEKYLTIVDI